jgi:hypothetical protein
VEKLSLPLSKLKATLKQEIEAMRKILVALAVLLLAGSVNAATLAYYGTLSFGLATLPGASATTGPWASGITAGGHISTISFGAGQIGPIQTSLPVTSSGTVQSVRLSGVANLSGVMTGISGAPPGGGPMGLAGLAKICLFSAAACPGANVPVPLTPTVAGGLGVGGVQFIPGAVALTMVHMPWTVGTVAMTIHTPQSTVTTPTLPAGIAAPPSGTATPSGVLQLVTISKVYTSLAGAFPELPVYAVLTLHFVPEPGTLLLLGSGVAGLAIIGRKRRR